MDPYTCLCNLLSYVVLVELCEENLASHRFWLEREEFALISVRCCNWDSNGHESSGHY